VSELALGTLTSSPEDAGIIFAAAASGRLKARIRAYPFYTVGSAAWDAAGIGPGTGDALARISGYTLVADGSNQGFTGLQREPYLDSDSRGTAYMSPEEMTAVAIDRASEGWPLALHANGDAGIDMVLDAGFSLHSDFMVTDPDPMHMIQMAVTRRTWKEPDFVLNAAERVSVESAIRAMTSVAAWQLFSEHEIGSLEVGKLADLVILEEDPRRVDPEAIRSIRVLETWMDGERVHAA
jgi:predicted amidohydrolase YtcJ